MIMEKFQHIIQLNNIIINTNNAIDKLQPYMDKIEEKSQ